MLCADVRRSATVRHSIRDIKRERFLAGAGPGLQNRCDLTASGWVGSIPIRSRQRYLKFTLFRLPFLSPFLWHGTPNNNRDIVRSTAVQRVL